MVIWENIYNILKKWSMLNIEVRILLPNRQKIPFPQWPGNIKEENKLNLPYLSSVMYKLIDTTIRIAGIFTSTNRSNILKLVHGKRSEWYEIHDTLLNLCQIPILYALITSLNGTGVLKILLRYLSVSVTKCNLLCCAICIISFSQLFLLLLFHCPKRAL